MNPGTLAVLIVGGIVAIKLLRNTSRQANDVTDNINETNAQAALLYSYFGIVKVGSVATATPVIKTDTLRRIGWLFRNVYDWPELQRAFTKLCGGNYTVLQAASTALSTLEYTSVMALLDTALMQKRIFCGNIPYHTLYNVDRYGGIAGENFDAGAYVGRCIEENDTYYFYISQRDGVKYAADKKYFITD